MGQTRLFQAVLAGLLLASAARALAAGEGAAASPGPGQGLPGFAAGPPAVASYRLTAELDPQLHRIRGEGTLTWRNSTEQPAGELFFHLYLNAFRNSASTWLRHEGREEAEILRRRGWGWIELTRLKDQATGTNLLPGLSYADPDNPEDRSAARVPLSRPVLPGEERSFSLSFISQLPWVVDRTGFAGDYHLAAQWFPKLGVFQGDGSWHCPPFHYAGEFYADFGDYDVTLVVPEAYVVGATGPQVERQEREEGKVAYRHLQPGVHDFAWTAWPDFVDLRRTYRHPQLPGVELRLLLRPENRGKAGRYFAALEHALTSFGLWYGPYPYPTLTMVDPSWAGWESGGMEYPTFITTGSRLLSPPLTLSPEEVTVHEFGHQYFYGLLASDEFQESYLDEGLTTWATARVMRRAYPARAWSFRVWEVPLVFPGIRLSTPLDTSARYFRHATADPITRTSWGYRSRGTYGALTYSKMALLLAQIEAVVGSEAMEKAMRAYTSTYRFRHPRTADLAATLARETGHDLGPHFEQLLFGSDVLDYAVAEARSRPHRKPVGIFGDMGERWTAEKAERLPGYESEVLVERRGGVRLPVTVELAFADGRKVRRSWDGEERWVRYRIRGPQLQWAEVDPDQLLLLDIDRLNNSRRTAPDRRASRRWGQRLRFWIQSFLETVFVFA